MQQDRSRFGGLYMGKGLPQPTIPKPCATARKVAAGREQDIEGNIGIIGMIGQMRTFAGIVRAAAIHECIR